MQAVGAEEICAQCGRQGAGLKRCAVCKQASYCGAVCQKADWKHHKQKFHGTIPLVVVVPPVEDVIANVDAAHATRDWRGVLKWKGRMEELLGQSDGTCSSALRAFA